MLFWLLLAVYFIFILDYRNDVRQNPNSQQFFCSSSKWVPKIAETTCNIDNAFGSGTTNEHAVQWWFKKFCKGDECLEVEEHSG